METISVNKTDEVLQTLKKIDKKIDLLEAKSIENISKLIDDKFSKNFLKVGSIQTQKLSDELDFEIKDIQLKNEIEKFAKRKKDIQKLLLDKNIQKLSKNDQEILSKLDKISSKGGILDRFLKSLEKDGDFSYFNLLSSSFLSSSIFDIERKLSDLAKISEPIIP